MNCAFISNNSVINIAYFDEQNDEIAELIAAEHGFETYVWTENPVRLFDHYENGEFVPCPIRAADEAAQVAASELESNEA